MPLIRLSHTYTDRGEEATISVDFIDIPLQKARVVDAGVSGTLRRHEMHGERLDVALADVPGSVARLVSGPPDEVVFEVTKG